ncbi:histidine phosphatase family protein [bacterium]|nr:histidine phosphatase family protein [bacterium]
MRILFVRNAEHANHGKGKWPEKVTALSAVGAQQAAALAGVLANGVNGRILSSPTERALATVRHLAERMNCQVEHDAAFAPLNVGGHVGKPYEETRKAFGDIIFTEILTNPSADRLYFDGGETLSEMAERAWARVLELVDQDGESNKVIVICSHEEVIGALLCKMAGMPLPNLWWWGGRFTPPLYANVSEVLWTGANWRLVSFGNISHLHAV